MYFKLVVNLFVIKTENKSKKDNDLTDKAFLSLFLFFYLFYLFFNLNLVKFLGLPSWNNVVSKTNSSTGLMFG
jgi:hypothetical protein